MRDPASQSCERLLHAALASELKEVQRLIRGGVSVNCRDSDGNTPLHQCAKYGTDDGDLAVMKVLLQAGSDHIDALNKYGQTALHLAAQDNAVMLMGCLLDAGAEVNACDREGRSPLAYAHNYPAITYLLKRGADASASPGVMRSAASDGDIPRLRALLLAGADIDDRDEWGNTALNRAAMMGRYDTVRFLIQQGATDKGEESLLIAAVYSGNIDLMAYCVTHLSEDINDIENRSGKTALHQAVWYGKTAAVHYLLAHGANPYIRNSDGATVFDYAKDKEAIRWMLLKHAEQNSYG